MIFNVNEIKLVSSILKRIIGLNEEIINKNENYTEAKLFLSIKQSIQKHFEDKPKINSLSITISKSLINYKRKSTPNEFYIGLKEYAKNRNLRIGVIKKILHFKGYIVENYPTGKSFRMNVVFTTYHKYKNLAMKKRVSQILTLWKKDFLDRVIKKSVDLVEELSEKYSYSKPRSINECKNMLKIHYEYLSKLKFSDIESILDYIVLSDSKKLTENQINRLKILKRYLNFYNSNYIK